MKLKVKLDQLSYVETKFSTVLVSGQQLPLMKLQMVAGLIGPVRLKKKKGFSTYYSVLNWHPKP